LFLWHFGRHSHWFLPLLQSLLLLHFPRGNFLAGAYWTLPVELSFYFLVFVMIRFGAMERIQWLAVILILWSAPYSLALLLNSCGLVHWPWVDFGFGLSNMLLLRHGLYFGLGILVWLFKERQIGRIGVVAGGLALILGAMEVYGRTVEYLAGFARAEWVPPAIWHHLVLWAEVGFYSGFIAIVCSVRFNHLFPADTALKRIVRSLGLMTYPLYLLHERVEDYAIYELNRVGLNPLPCVLASLVCLGAISLFIASYCEPAMRRLLRKSVRVQNLVSNHEG
jgi:peptidoglycan/LPS O-acetylase OafA/YrhL